MQMLNSYFDHQNIILTSSFYSTISNRNHRVFHSHNCIEMAYVLMGTADQSIVFPDGRMETQKLSKGNYVIIDTQAKHAYKNGSDDFTVINLLFKPSFLLNSGDNDRNSSKHFSIKRSEWHEEKSANEIEIKFELSNPQPVNDQEFIRMWLDLAGDSEELDFSEARVGLITDNNISEPFVIGGSERIPFYFLGEGAEKWVTMYHGKNGFFGADNGSSVKGLRGWFAFPIKEMRQDSTGKGLSRDDVITGVYFYYSVSDKSMANKYLYIDDITMLDDYRGAKKKILRDDSIIDFGKGIQEILLSGKNGNISPEVYPEQIVVGTLEYEAFYDFLKKIYTEIDYEKIPSKTMNHVYFDGDRSLLSLFKLCHYSSREQWYEWNQIVKNALSLIVLLSLQSMIASTENKKKENILDIVKNYVELHYAEDITLREICEKHFYNVSYISRKFKKTVGCTFEQYLRQIRIERAGEMLRATDMSVSDIADRCGYTSVRSFRKAFVFVTGKTPIEFKKIYKFSKY